MSVLGSTGILHLLIEDLNRFQIVVAIAFAGAGAGLGLVAINAAAVGGALDRRFNGTGCAAWTRGDRSNHYSAVGVEDRCAENAANVNGAVIVVPGGDGVRNAIYIGLQQ